MFEERDLEYLHSKSKSHLILILSDCKLDHHKDLLGLFQRLLGKSEGEGDSFKAETSPPRKLKEEPRGRIRVNEEDEENGEEEKEEEQEEEELDEDDDDDEDEDEKEERHEGLNIRSTCPPEAGFKSGDLAIVTRDFKVQKPSWHAGLPVKEGTHVKIQSKRGRDNSYGCNLQDDDNTYVRIPDSALRIDPANETRRRRYRKTR